MNRTLMMHLIAKDWYLSRLPLTLIALAGAVATGLLYSGKTAGLVGLISALISLIFLSILIPQLTVVNERKQGNLAFVMSLPISPAEFTMSKVLGNLSAFVLLWAAIVGPGHDRRHPRSRRRRPAGRHSGPRAVRFVLPLAVRGDRHRVRVPRDGDDGGDERGIQLLVVPLPSAGLCGRPEEPRSDLEQHNHDDHWRADRGDRPGARADFLPSVAEDRLCVTVRREAPAVHRFTGTGRALLQSHACSNCTRVTPISPEPSV